MVQDQNSKIDLAHATSDFVRETGRSLWKKRNRRAHGFVPREASFQINSPVT
jgi:hypothetical protein